MRTALIVRFDRHGREQVAFYTDPAAAKLAFKTARFDEGSLELWTSSKGRIKSRSFTGRVADIPVPAPDPVQTEPEPEQPKPIAQVEPEAKPEPEPAAQTPVPTPAPKPQAPRRSWKR